jgi:hypothetical protein
MRAPETKRGARLRVFGAAAAVAIAGGLLALRAERGPARAAPAVAAAPVAAQPAPVPEAVPRAAPAALAAPMAQAPAAARPGSEEDLMDHVRAEVDARPEVAVALAEDGEVRFPSGRYADERAFLRMRALVHLGEIGVARAAAAEFFERHPDSPLGRYVFRLTGMRPPPVLGPRS